MNAGVAPVAVLDRSGVTACADAVAVRFASPKSIPNLKRVVGIAHSPKPEDVSVRHEISPIWGMRSGNAIKNSPGIGNFCIRSLNPFAITGETAGMPLLCSLARRLASIRLVQPRPYRPLAKPLDR